MNMKRRSGAVEAQLNWAMATCAQRDMQLTDLRRRVFRLILKANGPLTAYQLLGRLKKTRKGAVPPTIYRVLDFLIKQQLIHRIERLNAFIACAESGHKHVAQFHICRKCGAVAEIDDRAVTKALTHAAKRKGFNPGNITVEIEGTCAVCARSSYEFALPRRRIRHS